MTRRTVFGHPDAVSKWQQANVLADVGTEKFSTDFASALFLHQEALRKYDEGLAIQKPFLPKGYGGKNAKVGK